MDSIINVIYGLIFLIQEMATAIRNQMLLLFIIFVTVAGYIALLVIVCNLCKRKKEKITPFEISDKKAIEYGKSKWV